MARFEKGHIPWHKGKTKEDFPILSLSKTGSKNPMFGVKGKDHPKWSDSKPSYRTLHKRLYSLFGKPKSCVVCGKYRTTPKSIQWANLDGKYKSINDFTSLCASCHQLWDKGNLAINLFEWRQVV